MQSKDFINEAIPEWILFHVPHNSTFIPKEIRHQFCLDDHQLENELLKMTDHHTKDLLAFGVETDHILESSVSRLVVDVERFPIDSDEIMSKIGMGAVYLNTSENKPLRHPISANDKQELILNWYDPHHQSLNDTASRKLRDHGKVLIIDCHSFPKWPLPYEMQQNSIRPQICIGTDPFHTPQWFVEIFKKELEARSFEVGLNNPFSGSLVPLRFFKKNPKVHSVMLEVRRDIYINELNGKPLEIFSNIAQRIRTALQVSLNQWRNND